MSTELNSKIKSQYNEYLNKITSISPDKLDDTRTFWLNHKDFWPELAHYARFVLSVPLTGAPIERVFSIGGCILAPNRRRLSDKLFEDLLLYYHLLRLASKKLSFYRP